MADQQDLKTPINYNVVSGIDNPAVKSAIELIKKSELIRDEKESEWEAIQEIFELGFEVSNPAGTRRFESQLLWQAVYKTVSKMKPLDATFHGSGADQDIEKVVTDGVQTVLTEAGFPNVLRDKFGAFYRFLLFGDSFVRVGTDNKDSEFPIKFQNTSLLNVYVDPNATSMRTPSGEKDVDELVAVYKYTWDEAVELYPELEKTGGPGKIPRSDADLEDLDETEDQELNQDSQREIEIAHYYNKSKERYTIFAGSALTVLEDLEGKEYPFVMKGEPYIPFIHFMGFPASEGFYNYGLGHILYKLAIVTRQLSNKATNYAMDNVDPIRIMNIPQGESAKFFNKILSAEEARASGRKGFIINEYGNADPEGGQTRIETLSSDALTQEWERLFNMFDREIKRLGINLDDVDRGAARTATQIIAEEENSDLFVKQILEQNASEFKFVYTLTLDFISKFISKNNKTPLNLTTKITVDGQEMRMDDITLGMVADEIKKRNYFVKVNSRSGAIPSNLMRQAQISRTLQFLPRGSPAQLRLVQQLAALDDNEVSLEEIGFQAGAGGEAPTEQIGQQPTATDALRTQRAGGAFDLAAIA